MYGTDHSAFTIIEVLVAVSVLALIVAMMAQVINSTTIATVASGRNIDSDTQVRCVFDRIESDLNCALKRDDLDFYFNTQNGNDEIYFYSEVDGYYESGDPAMSGSGRLTDRNTVALVGYRLNDKISGGTRFELERLSRGLHWWDTNQQSGLYTSISFLPSTIADCFRQVISDPYNNSSNLGPTSQWDVIADQIFRFELSFLLTDGTISKDPFLSGQTPAHSKMNWRSDVVAIIVTAATVDKGSRSMLSNIGLLSVLVMMLADSSNSGPSTTGTTPASPTTTADMWTQKINDCIKAPPAGVPKSVMSAVRVYQRCFYLNGQLVPK